MKISSFDSPNLIELKVLAIIAELDELYFPYPWSKEQWKKELEKEESLLIIATKHEELLGFCLFSISKFEKMAHLLKILVKPSHRKKGLGKKMHDSIFSDTSTRDLESLFLEVSTKNESAVKLYKKLGYRVLVLKKKFYSNGSDAYAMQRKIN